MGLIWFTAFCCHILKYLLVCVLFCYSVCVIKCWTQKASCQIFDCSTSILFFKTREKLFRIHFLFQFTSSARKIQSMRTNPKSDLVWNTPRALPALCGSTWWQKEAVYVQFSSIPIQSFITYFIYFENSSLNTKSMQIKQKSHHIKKLCSPTGPRRSWALTLVLL